MIRMLLILVIVAVIPSIVHPNDLSKVPLWDGETIDCRGTLNEELLANRFGGSVVVGERLVISHTATTVHSGRGGFELNATIGEDHAGFAGIALTGFAPTNEIDTRDLSRFEEVSLWLKNETEAPFTFSLEIKDFRDSGDHRAKREFVIGASNKWQELTALLPPTPANGWMVTGTPDISRIKLMTFVIESDRGLAVNGSIFLDDVFLSETGGALDVAIVPINDILRRLAKRTFAALWGSRDRDTGLVPLNSSFADVVALNSTAGLIKILPRAVSENWVSQAEADSYVALVIASLDAAMNKSQATHGFSHLPPRYLDRLSLEATFRFEESIADVAFMFLALYQYQSLPEAPAMLINDIDALLNRFNFAAFGTPQGWKLAFVLNTGMFTEGTYDGYSGEM